MIKLPVASKLHTRKECIFDALAEWTRLCLAGDDAETVRFRAANELVLQRAREGFVRLFYYIPEGQDIIIDIGAEVSDDLAMELKLKFDYDDIDIAAHSEIVFV